MIQNNLPPEKIQEYRLEQFKKFIEPYEQRIKELENSIEKKNQELVVLKYGMKGVHATIKALKQPTLPGQRRPGVISSLKPPTSPVKPIFKSSPSKFSSTMPRSQSTSRLSTPIKREPSLTTPTRYNVISPQKVRTTSSSARNTPESARRNGGASNKSPSPGGRDYLHRRSGSWDRGLSRSATASPSRFPHSRPSLDSIGDIDQISPVKDQYIDDVIEEEIDVKVESKKILYYQCTKKARIRFLRSVGSINLGIQNILSQSEVNRIMKRAKNIYQFRILSSKWKLNNAKGRATHLKIPTSVNKVICQLKIDLLCNEEGFEVTDSDILKVNLRHFNGVREVYFTSIKQIKNLSQCVQLRNIIYRPPLGQDSDFFDFVELIKKAKPVLNRLCLTMPYEDRFSIAIEDLVSYAQNSEYIKTYGLDFIFKEGVKVPEEDKIHSMDWSKMNRLSIILNHYIPYSSLIESQIAPKLKILDLKVDAGFRIDALHNLELLNNLRSLKLTSKLPMRGYQNFFKLCTIPIGLTKLAVNLHGLPAKELFDSKKEYNPRFDKKLDNHENYCSFARRIQRLYNLKSLSFEIDPTKPFETWMTYLATCIISVRMRLKYFSIVADVNEGGNEPLDFDEVVHRITYCKCPLRDLQISSKTIKFGGKSSKILHKLERMSFRADIEALFHFKLPQVFEHVHSSKITYLDFKIDFYSYELPPLLDKVAECVNLKHLAFSSNAENMTGEEFDHSFEQLMQLRQLDYLYVKLIKYICSESQLNKIKKLQKQLCYARTFNINTQNYPQQQLLSNTY